MGIGDTVVQKQVAAIQDTFIGETVWPECAEPPYAEGAAEPRGDGYSSRTFAGLGGDIR
ncbi:MAG TPA: hypothetical protein VMX12_01045 [Acidimicrobiia bacterium]|nr:hypothetical protein [Acidimicrobiia bacterium]